jgi:hypothetical protein
VQKFFSCANPQFHWLFVWLVSDDLAGEEAKCVGPGLARLHEICICEAGRTAKFSKIMLEASYGEINITFSGNSSGGHSNNQHANCKQPQHFGHLWHCAHFRVSFYCVHYKVDLCNDPLLDMPNQVDGLSWQRRNARKL